jgi:putative oxidoreductase
VRFHDYAPDLVAKAGFPSSLGYLVYVGEVVAPVLLILGLWTRPAALIVVINMVVAILLVHTHQFLTVSASGGWSLELQGMYLITALAITLLGAGRFSVGGTNGRWN